MNKLNRRDFVKTSAAVSSFFVLPPGLLANSPIERVCTAHIGTGGKGRVDTAELVKHERVQPVGFCDVDRTRGMADSWLPKHNSAKFFQDYRETLAGFDYAGPLAESLCLGVVACQFPGKRLEWDAQKMRVKNLA
ncbi:MAG: hypothetical protein CMO43_09850 [Verrucomicrobiales bacterium]|jgi:hypothetical protein|nr:hypothetical protein [Verrucomicrobiales bacterium]MDP6677930.1 hypothetical protein [Verrucomicrobiota bacterium]MDP6752299.1 hypothetical protein [Verrucomicrobiota bacterium]MDP7052371.1 hypothetical protein [Verrucomicrobiota bacterium]|tara:strand:+ start:167 stop:571 length:405 start_codon:yes stop_codon:yes gene_type:complete